MQDCNFVEEIYGNKMRQYAVDEYDLISQSVDS